MKLSAAVPVAQSPDEVWHALLALLPSGPELERVARTTGAIRRKRGVKGATELLRIALSYSFCNLSFKDTAAWSYANQTAAISKWGVLHRLRRCGDWLVELVSQKLSTQIPPVTVGGFALKLIDASRIAQPGSKGETWRLHAVYDPLAGRLLDLQLTGNEGGERLDRFEFAPGDLVIGDRGYAHRRGLAHVAASSADFLVRINWYNVPLEHQDGGSFDLFGFLRGLKGEVPGEVTVRTVADKRNSIPSTECRLVAVRKSEAAAEAARAKVIAEAKKQKRTLTPQTLEACGYILVLTSVTTKALDAVQVLALYKLRWQIELLFKRMKSLLKVDSLRTRHVETARAAIAAKILGALLVQELASIAGVGASWNYTQLMGKALEQALLGCEAVKRLIVNPALPVPWLKEAPRNRQQQCPVTWALLLDCS